MNKKNLVQKIFLYCTRAIFVVDIFGHRMDLINIIALCKLLCLFSDLLFVFFFFIFHFSSKTRQQINTKIGGKVKPYS